MRTHRCRGRPDGGTPIASWRPGTEDIGVRPTPFAAVVSTRRHGFNQRTGSGRRDPAGVISLPLATRRYTAAAAATGTATPAIQNTRQARGAAHQRGTGGSAPQLGAAPGQNTNHAWVGGGVGDGDRAWHPGRGGSRAPPLTLHQRSTRTRLEAPTRRPARAPGADGAMLIEEALLGCGHGRRGIAGTRRGTVLARSDGAGWQSELAGWGTACAVLNRCSTVYGVLAAERVRPRPHFAAKRIFQH